MSQAYTSRLFDIFLVLRKGVTLSSPLSVNTSYTRMDIASY